MNQVMIVSVMHTGTGFMRKLLSGVGVGCVNTHWEDFAPKSYPESMRFISPLRHPYDTFVSWYSRDKFGPAFFKQWNEINEAYLKDEIAMILPLDLPNKNEHLHRLSLLLGVEIATDWQRVSSWDRKVPPQTDISEVYGLQIVKDFYGELNVS